MKTPFRAVLLKPLDQQHEVDNHIDPAGVEFDPEMDYPIWQNFGYRVPEDVLGKGRVIREEDGSLIVEGELNDDWSGAIKDGRFPYYLAIGIVSDKVTDVFDHSRLMSIGFTSRHADPTQPEINIINR